MGELVIAATRVLDEVNVVVSPAMVGDGETLTVVTSLRTWSPDGDRADKSSKCQCT